MNNLRCFLIGTKNIGARILEELLAQDHEVMGVFSEDEEDTMQVWKNELEHRSVKKIANDNPMTVVILFIMFFTFLFKPSSNT